MVALHIGCYHHFLLGLRLQILPITKEIHHVYTETQSKKATSAGNFGIERHGKK